MLGIQTGDMKRHPVNGIEGAMVCTSLGSLLRPLFYFLDNVSYPQSVQTCAEKRDFFAKRQPGVAGCSWLQPDRNFLSTWRHFFCSTL